LGIASTLDIPPYFSRDLENLSPNLSPNLSLALSYKEREAEYIFLFGEALNSPPWNKKRSIRWLPPSLACIVSTYLYLVEVSSGSMSISLS